MPTESAEDDAEETDAESEDGDGEGPTDAEGEEEQLPLIGRSPAMQEIYRVLARLMGTDLTVTVYGESGTGKELVAQALHRHSPRSRGPFVALNMAAIPRDLLESELFGHEKGAFTGADSARAGRFEQADGGTLFLDEIGDMPLDTQVKLLRVLEERQVMRVGGEKTFMVDVRVLAATNRNLEEAIVEGTFRSDLYFRLKVVAVDIPRLADRRDDVIPLMDHFRRTFAKRHKKTINRVQPEVTRKFYAYDWPGNVRELRNVLERAMIFTRGAEITADGLTLAPPGRLGEMHAAGEAFQFPMGRTLKEVEKAYIQRTLETNDSSYADIASSLGISKKTLWDKRKRYDLDEIVDR